MVRKHASLVNDEEINGAAWAAARGGTVPHVLDAREIM